MLFYPLNWVLNMSSRSILKALGIKEAPQHEILSDVEIEGLIEASAEHGKMPMGQAEYIYNVFRFGDLEVSDVMVHRTEMVTINADNPPEEIVSAGAAAHTPPSIWRVPRKISSDPAAKDSAARDPGAQGDLSKIDVVRWRGRQFVPDIRRSRKSQAFGAADSFRDGVDEYAGDGAGTLEVFWRRSRRHLRRARLGATARQADRRRRDCRRRVPIRDSTADGLELTMRSPTIAGLVIHEARSIPEAGQSFTFHGFRFRVLKKERNRITSLHVTPLSRKAATAKVA